MAASEINSGDTSHLLVSSQADFVSSACKFTQELLNKGPRVTIELINKPCLREIRDCSRSGCEHCWLVWHGVSTVMRTAYSSHENSWESATVFGMVLENDDKLEWLRIGLVAPRDMDTGSAPREWIDFQWSFENCHWDAITSQDENPRERLAQHMPMKTAPISGEDEISLARSSNPLRSSDIPINTNLLQSWMSMCQVNHSACAESHPRLQEMPTRLINISMGDGTEDVFLHEKSSDEKFKSYIALSYCWGRALTLRTTADNVDSHRNRIVWEDLPTLFQNVISLCRIIGVRYVWIDALCIIQGDLADWIQEGSRMVSYFGNSVLTIAADTAANALHTIWPKASVPPYVITGPGAVRVKVSRVPLHFNMESLRLHQTQPACMPLTSRAWAFQERLMPPRILHFGPEEMVWECASALDCGCGTPVDVYHGRQMRHIEPFRAYHHRALNTNTIQLDEYWEEMLETYLARHLTFGRDRLSAIMGLAKQFQAVQNPKAASEESLGQYILGLWSADLIRSLLWFTITPTARNAGFPTWTWASVAGTWIYQAPPPRTNFTSTAKVMEQPSEMWDVDWDSTALRTDLILSGLVVPAKLVPVDTTYNEFHWALRTGLPIDSDLELVVNLDLESHDDWNNSNVVCIQIGISELTAGVKRARGLVLQEREEGQSYRRLGVMRASEDWYYMASYKTLTLF